MKAARFLPLLKNMTLGLLLVFMSIAYSGCLTPNSLLESTSPSLEYNWHRKNFHPTIEIIDRRADSVEYQFTLPNQDFMPGSKSILVVKISILSQDQWKTYLKKYYVPAVNEAGFFSGRIKVATDSLALEGRILFKEINTIRQEEFPLDLLPFFEGPFWQRSVHNQIIDIQEPLRFNGPVIIEFAKRSEKLPSPPFSANQPFIPNELIRLSLDSNNQLLEQHSEEGCYLVHTRNHTDLIQRYKNTSSENFPQIQFQYDLIGPMRYLCSKDEFEKIQRSNEGAENQLEKFWITCGGGKEKGRELIQLYYKRVENANIYFTKYADGWRTDRGMIYLVFGHPVQVKESPESSIWYYGSADEPTTLKFEFKKTIHPTWGEIYLLDRSEKYRDAWEYQVTLWRQGKIFD
jgi:GWxTD domain-containing protein